MENYILLGLFIWGMSAFLGLAALGLELYEKHFRHQTSFYWSAYEA